MNLIFLEMVQQLCHPVLDVLFQLITMCGEQVLLAGLFCALYWCFDKRLGLYLVATLSTSICLNGVVKDIVRAPRPIGLEGVSSLRTFNATGYSFPSAHAQSAATFWWGLARWCHSPFAETAPGQEGVTARCRKQLCGAWVLWAAAALIVGVGFSRLYLGLHFPTDVLGGILLGLAVAEGMRRLVMIPHGWMVIVALCIASMTGALLLGQSKDTFVAGFMAAGVLFGWMVEHQFVDFAVPATLRKKALRLIPGCILVCASFLLPRALIPMSVLGDCVGAFCVAFMGIGGYPWLFKTFRF